MVSVDDIRNKTFQTVRFREGYDVDEVDDFLDEVIDRMKAGNPMTAAELAARTFQTVRFKEGYDVAEVDGFLDELAHGVTTDDKTADGETAGSGAGARPSASGSDGNPFSNNSPFSGDEAQIPW